MDGTVPRGTTGATAMRALRLVGLVIGGLVITVVAELLVALALSGFAFLHILPELDSGSLGSSIRIAMGFGYVAVLMSLAPLFALVVTRDKPRLGVTVWWLLLVGALVRLVSAAGILVTADREMPFVSYSYGFYDFQRGPVPLFAASVALAACMTLVVLYAKREWRRMRPLPDPPTCESDAAVAECHSEQALPADGVRFDREGSEAVHR